MSSKSHRYPGTRPFEAGEQAVFYGRTDDSLNLYRRIVNEKTVLLYSKTGLGKSSLINAGVLPLMEAATGFEVIPIRFNNHNPGQTDYEKPLDKLVAKISERPPEPAAAYLEKIISGENSLWYRFKRRQRTGDERVVLFVFDQFEELLTYPEEDIFHFKKQFSSLLFSTVPVNISTVLNRKLDKNPQLLTEAESLHLAMPMVIKGLFSIRSDRMSELNRITDYFPNIQKSFYELKPLTREQSREAIVMPAGLDAGRFISPRFRFRPPLVDTILDALEDKTTHSLESFQLQIVCRWAEDMIIAGKTRVPDEISTEDLGDIQAIFAESYQRLLAAVPDAYRDAVQQLIEESLIVSGNRVPVPEIVILKQYGLPQEILDTLLDSHFLRAEPNSTGGRSIELSHDTLIAPLLDAFAARSAEQQRREEEAQLREEAARQAEELRIATVKAEEARARAQAEEALRREAQEAQHSAERSLKRVRLSTIGMAILLVLLVTAGVLLGIANHRNKETEARLRLRREQLAAQLQAARLDHLRDSATAELLRSDSLRRIAEANSDYQTGLRFRNSFDSLAAVRRKAISDELGFLQGLRKAPVSGELLQKKIAARMLVLEALLGGR